MRLNCRVSPATDAGIVPICPDAENRFTGECCNSPHEGRHEIPTIHILPGLPMKRSAFLAAAACAALGLATPLALAQASKPIRIGVPTAMQLQVGRDTQDSIKMAIDDINAKGGVLGRKLEMVVADETENPETGISAIKKLTADEKVDVLIGGYTSGVTLAQLPHISSAKTIYLGVGAASPSIQAKVKTDYDNYKYVFRVGPLHAGHQARQLTDFISTFVKGELGISKIAIVGENAKWVQDLVPLLKNGATDAGADVRATEFFDTQTSDFSPLLSKVKDSGAQYLIVVLSHASSDIFAKQWYDSRFPMPYGGIDVKSMDGDFCERVGGKSMGEMAANFAVRAPLTPKTIPFFDEFRKRTRRAPGLHRVRRQRRRVHLRRGRSPGQDHRRTPSSRSWKRPTTSASRASSSSTRRTT